LWGFFGCFSFFRIISLTLQLYLILRQRFDEKAYEKSKTKVLKGTLLEKSAILLPWFEIDRSGGVKV
jgi:hypothetical protein